MPISPPPPDRHPDTPALTLDGIQVAVSGRIILDVPRLVTPVSAHIGIAGVSGSGKTTLLQVIAGLRPPTAGRVLWGDTDIAALPPQQGDAWRRATIGLVFQDFQLIPELTVLENVLLPAQFAARRIPATLQQRARDLLALVGVRASDQRVSSLSRGEQQRVAIARAVLHRPTLILADEPTASLDPANAADVVGLLISAARETGATLIIVSHDPLVLSRLDQTLPMTGGHLMPRLGTS
jgi:putative ABC transport system ATP-binding protein